MSDKQKYICVNTVIGFDDLEGRYTKRPGDVIELDPADKDTQRLLRVNAIREDGVVGVNVPAVNKAPIDHVDTSGDDAGSTDADDGLGDDAADDSKKDADDGLSDDTSKDPPPPAAPELTVAPKKVAAKAPSSTKK